MITTKFLPKMCHSQEISVLAARYSLMMTERGITRYGWSWDKPCIAAFDDGYAVGFLSLKEDDDEFSVSVTGAYTEKDCPRALTALLAALRAKYKDTPYKDFYFTYHEANPDMQKICKALKTKPHSYTVRVQL